MPFIQCCMLSYPLSRLDELLMYVGLPLITHIFDLSLGPYLRMRSCEMPIQREHFSLVIHAASGTLYSLFILQIFMSLHVPAVASASPVHVPPVQCVLKHCGVHIYINIHAHCQYNLRTPQLVGLPTSWGVLQYRDDIAMVTG